MNLNMNRSSLIASLAVTDDRHIVLCHDTSLKRVALQPQRMGSQDGAVRVTSMPELVRTSLKNGVALPAVAKAYHLGRYGRRCCRRY